MTTKPESFGQLLHGLRLKKRIGLREVCREVNYDPSNWSKIERGKMSPPEDVQTLSKWAIALGIENNSLEFQEFIDSALIAQGLIPKGLSETEMLTLLPAFFRTVRNEKPTKADLDDLMKLIKESTF